MRKTIRTLRLIVDNASSDRIPEIIRTKYEEITFIETIMNSGYAAGNNFCSIYTNSDIIVIANPGTVADPEWLYYLVKPLVDDLNPAATMSKVLIYGQVRINTCSNPLHFTGLGFCKGMDYPSSMYQLPEEVSTVSGCSFAISSSVFNEINGFDQDYCILKRYGPVLQIASSRV